VLVCCLVVDLPVVVGVVVVILIVTPVDVCGRVVDVCGRVVDVWGRVVDVCDRVVDDPVRNFANKANGLWNRIVVEAVDEVEVAVLDVEVLCFCVVVEVAVLDVEVVCFCVVDEWVVTLFKQHSPCIPPNDR